MGGAIRSDLERGDPGRHERHEFVVVASPAAPRTWFVYSTATDPPRDWMASTRHCRRAPVELVRRGVMGQTDAGRRTKCSGMGVPSAHSAPSARSNERGRRRTSPPPG